MSEGIGKIFRNRSGAIIAGIIAAVLAVILLVVYLHSYRSSVNSGSQAGARPRRDEADPQGHLRDADRAEGPLPLDDRPEGSAQAERDHRSVCAQRSRRRRGHLPRPAADAGRLHDRVLDLDPVCDHGPAARDRRSGGCDARPDRPGRGRQLRRCVRRRRAEPSGQLVTLLAPDVYVLVAAGAGSSNTILRINTQDAAKFAFAADNTKLWLVLRPQVGASRTPPSTATLATLLARAKR